MSGPVALFLAEPTLHGTWYHPANRLAENLCGFAGSARVRHDKLVHLVESGIRVAQPNGQTIETGAA